MKQIQKLAKETMVRNNIEDQIIDKQNEIIDDLNKIIEQLDIIDIKDELLDIDDSGLLDLSLSTDDTNLGAVLDDILPTHLDNPPEPPQPPPVRIKGTPTITTMIKDFFAQKRR